MNNGDIFPIIIIVLTVIIPLAIIFSFIYKIKSKELESKIDNSEKVQFQEEMASLKHRVMMLEKIVTDKGYQLDEEIEKLKSVN